MKFYGYRRVEITKREFISDLRDKANDIREQKLKEMRRHKKRIQELENRLEQLDIQRYILGDVTEPVQEMMVG